MPTPTHPLRQTKPAECENGAHYDCCGVRIWTNLKETSRGFGLPGQPMGIDGVVSGLWNTAVTGEFDHWLGHETLPPE